MPAEPLDRPAPDPDEIAAQSFTRARKGFEVDEVRAYLVSIASQVRDAQLKQDEVNRRLAELERRATDPRDLDEAQVTQLLGEETARVLEHARQVYLANGMTSRIARSGYFSWACANRAVWPTRRRSR